MRSWQRNAARLEFSFATAFLYWLGEHLSERLDFIEETESTATNGLALAASQVARYTRMRFSKANRKVENSVVLVAKFRCQIALGVLFSTQFLQCLCLKI
jgi:hypothetical protein